MNFSFTSITDTVTFAHAVKKYLETLSAARVTEFCPHGTNTGQLNRAFALIEGHPKWPGYKPEGHGPGRNREILKRSK